MHSRGARAVIEHLQAEIMLSAQPAQLKSAGMTVPLHRWPTPSSDWSTSPSAVTPQAEGLSSSGFRENRAVDLRLGSCRTALALSEGR